MEELIDQLRWRDDGRSRGVVALGDRPLMRFRPDGQRAVTELAFMEGSRFIDVSVQPEAPGQLLRAVAISRRRDPNAWEAVVARRLLTEASGWAIRDMPPDCERLGPVVGGLAFPLIRMAVPHGVVCPPFVPRWAEPVLACSDVRIAARTAFGDDASRRVVRTLPRSLVGNGHREGRPPALVPLALAMTLRGLVDPDGLANVMETAAAEHAPRHWPTVDQLDDLKRGFRELGADAATAVARDALSHEAGPLRLMTVAPHIRLLASLGAGPPPLTLEGVERALHEIQRRAPAPARRPRQPADPQFRYSPAAERIDGLRLGDHHLSLPRTSRQMQAWGTRLSNCIAQYAVAVSAGRSVVVGVHRGGTLVGALELDASLTTVRQFVRDHNQRPRRADRDAVSRMLQSVGIGTPGPVEAARRARR